MSTQEEYWPLAYDDNPEAIGDYVWIAADSTDNRVTRANRINAHKRAYEKEHNVTLTLLCKSYSETHGFLHQSKFRYEITRES